MEYTYLVPIFESQMETPEEYTKLMARKSKTRRSHTQQLLPQKNDYASIKQYNRHVRRMSPSAFIRLKYHVHVPLDEKRQRVSASEFRILRVGEHEELCRKNYNMNQLKLIAKQYTLPVSGNKQQLVSRLYNYLRLSMYAIRIQTHLRKYIVKQFLRVRGPAVQKRTLCVNDSDFYSLDSLNDIPVTHFVSILEQTGNTENTSHIYGFHIDSLIQYMKMNKLDSLTNPYTRNPFQTNIKECIRNCIRTAKNLGVLINSTKDIWSDSLAQIQSNVQTPEQEMRDLFQSIDEMGHLGSYTNPVWFQDLNFLGLRDFCLLAYDIWDYRIGMSPQMKLEMCGGSQTCLSPYSSNIFSSNISRTEMMNVAITLVRNLTTRGTTLDLKKNGAVIVLMALTRVHPDARNSFPALYESLV